MTRLLVSVRKASEVAAALAGGAELIDVKEPAHGPLGAADGATCEEVVRTVAGRVPVSVALGELQQLPHDWHLRVAGCQFAKVGLAAAVGDRAWQQKWLTWQRQLPAGTSPVAVIYADWEQAVAPPPGEVLSFAAKHGCRTILIDTFDKSKGSLIEYFGATELAWLRQSTTRSQLQLALAGSLQLSHLPELIRWQPDLIAVRSAACDGSREGTVSESCVAAIAQTIRELSRTSKQVNASR